MIGWARCQSIFKGVAIFSAGIFLGCLIKDYPLLTLDKSVSIVDIASLFVTIFIALMVPFLVERVIEAQKGIKSDIVNELKELIEIIKRIKQIITKAHTNQQLIPDDKDQIIYAFYEAELKVELIGELIDVAFKKHGADAKEELKKILLRYKNYLTGGELMSSTFQSVDDRFLKESNTEYSKIDTGLKKFIQKVYRY